MNTKHLDIINEKIKAEPDNSYLKEIKETIEKNEPLDWNALHVLYGTEKCKQIIKANSVTVSINSKLTKEGLQMRRQLKSERKALIDAKINADPSNEYLKKIKKDIEKGKMLSWNALAVLYGAEAVKRLADTIEEE